MIVLMIFRLICNQTGYREEIAGGVLDGKGWKKAMRRMRKGGEREGEKMKSKLNEVLGKNIGWLKGFNLEI